MLQSRMSRYRAHDVLSQNSIDRSINEVGAVDVCVLIDAAVVVRLAADCEGEGGGRIRRRWFDE